MYMAVGVGHQVLQVHALGLGFLFFRQDAHGDFHQQAARRQQDDGGDNVEQGVHVGNLRIRLPRREGLDEPGKGRCHAQDGEEDGAENIEHQVNDGGALGVAAGAHRGQHRRDAGADVLPKQHVHRAVKPDDAADGQRLQNAHRGGGGLDDSREQRPRRNAQKRV